MLSIVVLHIHCGCVEMQLIFYVELVSSNFAEITYLFFVVCCKFLGIFYIDNHDLRKYLL